MKRYQYVVFMIVLGVLAACASTEPAAESRDSVMDQAVTATDESMVMEGGEEAMTEEDMAPEEMAEDDSGMADEATEAMAVEDNMAADQMAEAQPMEHETAGSEAMGDEEMAADDAMDGAAMDDMSADAEEMVEAMALPGWGQIVLTNARTSETFTLSDFAGNTVFVEPMATWCTNCRRQLTNVGQVRTQLMDEDTTFIALSLETNISDETLAQYANAQGFDWLFAVMTPQMLQELADEFGRVITSAPSTPHFIIRPDGSFTDLITGIESPEQILQQLEAARG